MAPMNDYNLTPREEDLIVATFAQVSRITERYSDSFYRHLFEIEPAFQPMFEKVDMHTQGKLLMSMLTMAIKSISVLKNTQPELQALGKRHANYGVAPEHYPVFGDALIWTMEQELGADFSPEAKTAWKKLYGILSSMATSKE